MAQEMHLRSVGTVRNEQKRVIWGPGSPNDRTWDEKVAESKKAQKAVSEIEIGSDLDEILDGIEDFSHLWVFFWAHLVPDESRRSVVKGHPMGREDWPSVGIFATRSPVRPNSVCATVVRLLERNSNVLKVTGLDALDGTPVVDIKPYTPSDHPAGGVRMPDWMHRIHREFSAAKGENTVDTDQGAKEHCTDSRSGHVQ